MYPYADVRKNSPIELCIRYSLRNNINRLYTLGLENIKFYIGLISGFICWTEEGVNESTIEQGAWRIEVMMRI
jgi:hypothetical protein